MTIEILRLQLLWFIAIPAAGFALFFAGYFIGKWRQRRFNQKWGLPEEPKEDVDAAEVLGKTGVLTALGDIWHKH